MPFYRQMGSIPRKRHIEHRREGGYRGEGIYYEEVVTTAGFGRAYSIVYHLRPPTRVRKVEAAGSVALDLVMEPVLRHHHFKTGTLKAQGDPITGRVPLLTNADVTMYRCRPAKAQAELYRNASADEVLFVHKGQGVVQTMFGFHLVQLQEIEEGKPPEFEKAKDAVEQKLLENRLASFKDQLRIKYSIRVNKDVPAEVNR